MILTDVAGAGFSFAQQGVKAIILGNLAPFTHNMSKTTLALEALLFDLLFIVQHACLYTDRTDHAAQSVFRRKREGTFVETEAAALTNDLHSENSSNSSMV